MSDKGDTSGKEHGSASLPKRKDGKQVGGSGGGELKNSSKGEKESSSSSKEGGKNGSKGKARSSSSSKVRTSEQELALEEMLKVSGRERSHNRVSSLVSSRLLLFPPLMFLMCLLRLCRDLPVVCRLRSRLSLSR